MFTGRQLADWAERALEAGAKYWYGTCWYEADEDLLARKLRQYPSHYGNGRLSTYRRHIADKRMVCDCVGLIKGFFWTANGTAANRYQANNCPDRSANGMFSLCDEVFSIADMPDEPGLVVWMNGHIGIYVGNGEVIEARGYKYGVVRTRLKDRGWKKAGRLPATMLSYEGGVFPDYPLLRKGSMGEAVERMQALLIIWNVNALPEYGVDGEFGSETRRWVKKFQQAMGLETDGIVGPLSWAALNALDGDNE